VRRLLLTALAVATCLAGSLVAPADAAPRAPAQAYEAVIGQGSTFAALAIRQWTGYAGARGWPVSYTPTSSIQGLSLYQQNLADFAGTEAEYSSYGLAGGVSNVPRGYQYTPDVAGAVGIFYNVDDQAGQQVRSLRLSRRTIARIFIGDITRWNDPAITADNTGRQLPDRPITIIYRNGQSGTTALFYDFVQHTIPDLFNAWARRNGFSTSIRIIQLDTSPGFAPVARGYSDQDAIATTVASPAGKWSIAAVEAAYAETSHAQVAFVQNQSGNFVQPGAANISQALETAGLRGDISQDLSAVYATRAALGYPISAYSYMTLQCAPGKGPNCRGRYNRPGKEKLLADWMRYIACDGQAEMGTGIKGYSALPPQLSQEIANAIGRMTGRAAERLTQGNCGNPRFNPNFRLPVSGPAPALPPIATGGFGATEGAAAGAGGAAGGAAAAAKAKAATGSAATTSSSEEAAAGLSGAAARAVGGGTGDWLKAKPAGYDRPGAGPLAKWPWVVVILVLVTPLAIGVLVGAIRASNAARADPRAPW
jgi:phosphate transport system substrate-binding protein